MKINPYSNPFIVIEGIDGCGKSTLIEGIKKWDKKHGIGSIFTKEPTDGPIGATIRRILNNNGCDVKGRKFSPEELQGLYILDRLEHRQAEAAFLEKYPIFSDRDFISTIAYGVGGEVGFRWILKEHEEILNDYFFAPDLALILDLPAEEAVERLREKGKKADYFEKLEFLKEVRNGYLSFPRLIDEIYPDVELPCAVINASQSPEKVLKDSLFWIDKCFQEKLEVTEYIKIFKKGR
jgi:dTMP kinase